MPETILKLRYFERSLSKGLLKASFNLKSYFMDKITKNKLAWNYWSIPLQVTNQVPKNFSVSDLLPEQIWWCKFWVIPRTISVNLCNPVDDFINYSSLICHFESVKCGKKEETD